jgi:hypothetical protein
VNDWSTTQPESNAASAKSTASERARIAMPHLLPPGACATA